MCITSGPDSLQTGGIPYIATPTLKAPRDAASRQLSPRRLLGGRRALPQAVRRCAAATPGRACLVRAAARGGADRAGSRLRPPDHARRQRDQGAAPPDRRGPAGAARHGRPRHPRRRGGSWQDDRGEHRLQGARGARAGPPRVDPHAGLPGGPVAGGARAAVLRALRGPDRPRRLAARGHHQDHRRARPRAPEALRALTHEVMIRTRRSSVALDLDLPPRRPRHPEVKLTRAEADLYQRTTDFLRRLYREGFVQPAEQEEPEDGAPRRRTTKKGILQLAVIHLRQRLCSSSRALAESLAHLAESERISPEYRNIAKQLAKRAQGIRTHAKLDVLTKLLKETPDRLVIFSDHRPTIELIEERVTKLGRQPIVYWGAHSTAERDKRIRAFHEDQRSVLIATRAGSEGRNLQFCNVLVNYDLPWNPMVVEQRIGRLHRIGQKREVHIVNLAAAGTIESYILQLLDQKIKLFELVVGELDLILGEFGGAQKFEGRLAEEWLAAESEEDFARRVATLGADIEQSSAVGKEQEQLNSLIAPDDNAMRLEHRFQTVSVPSRLRLGLGTSQLVKGVGWDGKRLKLGLHLTDVLEALESIEPVGGATTAHPAGRHPKYGDLVRLTGLTSAGRAITLVAQVDRLPLALVDIEADA